MPQQIALAKVEASYRRMGENERPLATAPEPTRAHMIGLDGVRVFAILLVLVIHCDHWPLQQAGADQVWWSGVDLLARPAVPLFVMLSGFLLTHRHQDRLSLRTFLRRRMGRSLLPWMAWMPVYALVGVYLTGEVQASGVGVMQWVALGSGHLWYLLLIPQLYVMFQLWPSRLRWSVTAALVALAVQVGLCVYRLWGPADGPANGWFLPYGYEFFVFWVGYFGLGATLGAVIAQRGGLNWPSWPFWLALSGPAALLLALNVSAAPNASYAQGTGAFLRPELPLLVVPLFFAVFLLTEKLLAGRSRLEAGVRALSRYSLGIYLVHAAITYLPGRVMAFALLQQHLPLSLLGFALEVLATLLLSLAAVRLIVATPISIVIGLPPEPFSWQQRWSPRGRRSRLGVDGTPSPAGGSPDVSNRGGQTSSDDGNLSRPGSLAGNSRGQTAQ